MERKGVSTMRQSTTLMFSLLVAAALTSPAFAQKQPPGVPPGVPEQAEAAWNALTEAERQQALSEFESLITPHIETLVTAHIADRNRAKPLTPVSNRWPEIFSDSSLGELSTDNLLFTTLEPSRGSDSYLDSTADTDVDGLSDSLESQLADGFNPLFRVSSGEQGGTGFADFYDWTPQTVQTTYGSTPVRLKFRVRPLGFAGTPTQYGYLQIDYLTLWNRDDGLVLGSTCNFNLGVLLGLVGLSASEAYVTLVQISVLNS